MALATKCPQCGALFRVVADQLKLRGGLVRCGQCRAVFDAIGSLTYLDDSALAQTRTVTALTQPMASAAATPKRSEAERRQPERRSSESDKQLKQSERIHRSEPVTRARHGPRTRPAPTTTTRALGPATTLRIAPTAPATLANPALRRSAPMPADTTGEKSDDDAKRRARVRREKELQAQAETEAGVPTLIAPGAREAAGSIVDGIEVIEVPPLSSETEAKATRDADDASATEEPEFIRAGQARDRRGFSIIFGGGSLLLAALFVAQLAVIFRSELLARAPETRDMLVNLCGLFGCTVGWPAQVEQLAVIGSELQAIAGTDALELTAVIRNRATFRQALPALEVTLTDARNQPMARKVFSPADYLAAAGEPSSRIEEGLAAGSDYTIRIFFEARGVQPAGFLVYPFFI